MNKILGTLNVETDWDFGILFNGESFSDFKFDLQIESLDQLKNLEFLGAFGGPLTEDTNLWEIQEGIAEILKNPHVEFNNQGGNRGIHWVPSPFLPKS